MDITVTSTGKTFWQVDNTLAALLMEAFPASFERANPRPQPKPEEAVARIEEVRKRVHIRRHDYTYDVAVSFAGEVREKVLEVVREAEARGLQVFYDFDRQALLWGKDLRAMLGTIYAEEALFMLVFLSRDYPEKDWPAFEFEVGKHAANKRPEEYLLPVTVDDVAVVGLRDTVGHLDLRKKNAKEIADLLAEKVEAAQAQTEQARAVPASAKDRA